MVAMTIGYFSVIVFFLKMLIPLAIVGIIIALVLIVVTLIHNINKLNNFIFFAKSLVI